jgi:serine phosphatase RsbU (regulator of sigma subunit)
MLPKQTNTDQAVADPMATDQAVDLRGPVAPGPTLDRAELIEQVGTGLAGSLNLRRTAIRLMTLITPGLADWAVVIVPDGTTGGLHVLGGADHGFSDVVPMAQVYDQALGRVMRSGRTELLHVELGVFDTPVVGEGLATLIPHPRLSAEAAALRPADVVGLGLTARGTTVGALILVRGQGRGFDAQDVAFAEQISERAALALDSARLYEDSSRIASTLQRGLRPPSLPDIEGVRLASLYRPAAEHLDIGGDFYDVHGSDDDWLLALGDVSGKGVEAAAVTGRARQSIRTACLFDRRPTALLGALNTVLHETGTDKFVTVVCARLRRSGDGRITVELASAGHPPPIVLRSNGRVEQVDVFGTAVGMIPHVEYASVEIELRPNDTLLMFTDGIDEAFGADGMYGVERLLRLLPAYAGAAPEVVCEAVERSVIEHLDSRAHDDIALLAVTCGD